MDLNRGGRPEKTGSIVEPVNNESTLSDLGITKQQSHRWQLEADVPEVVFEQHVAETKAAGESRRRQAWLYH